MSGEGAITICGWRSAWGSSAYYIFGAELDYGKFVSSILRVPISDHFYSTTSLIC